MTDCRIWVRPERVFGTEEYSGWVARSKSTLRPISVTWCLNLHLSRVLTETELSSEETETESREQGQRQHGLFYPSFEKSSALCRGTAWIFRLILLYEEDPPDLRYKQLRQELSAIILKSVSNRPSQFHQLTYQVRRRTCLQKTQQFWFRPTWQCRRSCSKSL